MATITSTIKLVDQMTPTLNKISKAIDRVNDKSKAIGNANTWSNFNTGVERATKSSHNLYNTLRRVVYTLATLRGLKGAIDVSDNMMNATARINNINDGLYTTSEYLDQIYLSAQRSRGSFSTMANSVGKLGTVASDAFANVGEMIAFTELMNKLFVISGASAAESSNAMYQLTQAMAAGRLQGDEMRSILEQAPLLAQKLADYLGVTKGEIKKLGSEGVITADIIKAALFGAADDIEKKFSNMPKTIGQIWTEIKNHALNAFRPVIERIQKFINSPVFEKFKNKIMSMLTGIANAVIRVFDAFESSKMQNALSKISTAFGTIVDIASGALNWIAKATGFTIDNWDKVGQAIYAVVMMLLMYKAVSLAVSAVVCLANIAQGITAFISALMAGQAWAWVILIIVALIAALYLGVAAWNYFTDSAVSATGILFGAIAFVVACVWDLILGIWDLLGTIVDGIVFVGKVLWQVFVDIVTLIGVLLINTGAFVLNLVTAILVGIGVVAVNIGNTFVWLWYFITTWGSNVIDVTNQICDQLPLYWERFKAKVVLVFWLLVSSAVSALNELIQGARDTCIKMLTPFAEFANGVKSIFNSIKKLWNNIADTLSVGIDVPDWLKAAGSAIGIEIGDRVGITVGKFDIDETPITAEGWVDSVEGLNTSVIGKLSSAISNLANIESQIKPIDRHPNPLPQLKDYANWGDAWSSIKDAFNTFEYIDMPDTSDKYLDAWNDFKADLDQTWNSDQYSNPVEAYKNWYEKGKNLEDGVTGFVEAIGGIINALFGKSDPSADSFGSNSIFTAMDPNGMNQALNKNELPNSLEDLLGGYGGGGDLLGSIADNTGKSAGSTSNIEDTLNLAEEELELLRSIAEKEVINRFTTAEIKVDMTNNNNINSGMDLDGIVTHLSSKLYEELGVVASGVHY